MVSSRQKAASLGHSDGIKATSVEETPKEVSAHGGTCLRRGQRVGREERLPAQAAVFWKKLSQRAGTDQCCQIRGIGHSKYRQFFTNIFYKRERKSEAIGSRKEGQHFFF